MDISKRNFWRTWIPGAAPGFAAMSLLIGAAVAGPLTLQSGTLATTVGAVLLVGATVSCTIAFGRARIRARDVMLHVYPEWLHYLRPDHRYEAPEGVVLRHN